MFLIKDHRFLLIHSFQIPMLIDPFVNKPLVHYSASTPDSVEQKRQKNHKFNLIFVIYFVSYHSEFTPWKTSRSL